jgi:hypothetical protein
MPCFATGNVPSVRRIAKAGHFVQNEAPEAVNEFLISWLNERIKNRPRQEKS